MTMHSSPKPLRRWIWANRIGRIGAIVSGVLWPLTMAGGVTLGIPGGLKMALYGGSFNIVWRAMPTPQPAAFNIYRNEVGAIWWFPSFDRVPGDIELLLPLWCIAIAFACIGAIAWWKRRPRNVGGCSRCGYLLEGLQVCPECGIPAKSKTKTASRSRISDS